MSYWLMLLHPQLVKAENVGILLFLKCRISKTFYLALFTKLCYVVQVSHDEHLISGSVDELWCVSDGKATPFHGTFAEYKKTLRV